MKKNKGLYLLIAFIGVILTMFFVLFFMHERTLENGILFKVSFEYENAKNITYNFYNQNGKIGKVENWENYETSYLLEKTDYNSVKLLRKLIKGKATQKEPSKEEGITIYNGQNKKYYFLSFDSEEASYLSSLIIDGYIHAELKRTTGKTISNEIYLYEKEDGLNWTKDGSVSRIINTYVCEVEDCKYLYVDKEYETVLYDKVNYYYNYMSKEKEAINTSEKINQIEFVKWEGKIIGINLQNEAGKTCYYDLSKKECITEFDFHKIKRINNDLLVLQKETKKENGILYELIALNRWNKETIWKTEFIDQTNLEFEIEQKESNYLLKRINKKEETYQLLNESGKTILPKFVEELELDEEKNIIIKTQENNQPIYELYSQEGEFLKKSVTKEELKEKEKNKESNQ